LAISDFKSAMDLNPDCDEHKKKYEELIKKEKKNNTKKSDIKLKNTKKPNQKNKDNVNIEIHNKE
jgi:hypothetical protein